MTDILIGLGGAAVGAAFGYGYSTYKRRAKIAAGKDPSL